MLLHCPLLPVAANRELTEALFIEGGPAHTACKLSGGACCIHEVIEWVQQGDFEKRLGIGQRVAANLIASEPKRNPIKGTTRTGKRAQRKREIEEKAKWEKERPSRNGGRYASGVSGTSSNNGSSHTGGAVSKKQASKNGNKKDKLSKQARKAKEEKEKAKRRSQAAARAKWFHIDKTREKLRLEEARQEERAQKFRNSLLSERENELERERAKAMDDFANKVLEQQNSKETVTTASEKEEPASIRSNTTQQAAVQREDTSVEPENEEHAGVVRAEPHERLPAGAAVPASVSGMTLRDIVGQKQQDALHERSYSLLPNTNSAISKIEGFECDDEEDMSTTLNLEPVPS